jgi:molybdopterin synthase catalytic subunit
MFQITAEPLESLSPPGGQSHVGGIVEFIGLVRDLNEGREVSLLEYEVYEALAVKEGERILTEAGAKFPIEAAWCVHRVGRLEIGDLAIRVRVAAGHRAEAFDACRFIVDEVKSRVPIWKKEHYRDGDSGWIGVEEPRA